MTANDLDLLRDFTRDQSQDAFTALVQRHLDLVYCAALRQVRSHQLAEEVAQSVFTDLARNATRLNSGTILTAWLYEVTRRTAIDVVRGEARRQLREVGETLGTTDDAAQKRVSRAVERLREFFVRRGVTVGASGLAISISAHAVQAAPIGLGATITSTSALAGKTVITATTATVTKAIAMTVLQKALITASIAATLAIGTGAYVAYHQRANRLRLENQTDFPKESWADAGFATPQAALRTRGWAVLNGNRERFKESVFITDGARTMLEEMIAAAPVSESDKQNHPELVNMGTEDSLLFPMMAQNKRDNYTGYRLLSRQPLSPEELILDVETQMASTRSKTEPLKFRHFGRDWKVLIDEDLLKNDYKKFLNFTRSQPKQVAP